MSISRKADMSDDYKYVLVVGNLNEGYEFVGPFDSFDAADEYGSKRANTLMTWITPMFRPLEKGRDYD
jgi:hypothetical protein